MMRDDAFTSPARIAIVGAGAFGRGVAVALRAQGHVVSCLARAGAGFEAAQADGLSPLTLERAHLARVASDQHIVLLALPTRAHQGFFQDFTAVLKPYAASLSLLSLAKGLVPDIGLLPDLARDYLTPHCFGLISGPSFAADLMAGKPTALTLAHPQRAAALAAQLSGERLRFYPSTDVTGTALCGALKNVIAIACGLSDGLGMGDSARAALMTRGLAEIGRLLTAMGGQTETLASLAGIGDLALTSSSDKSRNYRYGFALAQGVLPDGMLAEGSLSVDVALDMAQQHGIELPICQQVSQVIQGIATPRAAATTLMQRAPTTAHRTAGT